MKDHALIRPLIRPLIRRSLLWVLPILLAIGLYHPSALAFTDEQQFLAEVWRIVNQAYLDESFNGQNWWFVRQQALRAPLRSRPDTYAAIQVMLATLNDPYTRLLPPAQYHTLQTNTAGELTGIGLQIAQDEEGHLQVVAPIAGSPADLAGIQPRDRVLAIDGVATATLTLDESAARMRGQAGTLVTLQVQRAEEMPFAVELHRDRIVLNPVYAELRTEATEANDLRVGYIRLNQFSANAASEMRSTLLNFEEQEAQAYILDLRNNPGGLLQAGIEIARLWLDAGTIVYTVNRQSVFDSFEAAGPPLTTAPLVVLVNGGTASSSEILAGALQDHERAQLVGETTYGKGLIQSLFDLADGSGLAVTIAKYETPNHHDINRLGITPDHVVEAELSSRIEFATPADPQYMAAIEVLQAQTAIAMSPATHPLVKQP